MTEDKLSLNQPLYVHLTPAGAYYAVSQRESSHNRQLLLNILRFGSNQPLDVSLLCQWSSLEDEESALTLLYRLQRLEFVYGSIKPQTIPEQRAEVLLPSLLEQLSDTGRALLAEQNGLYYATVGFHHESAEEIAALAGDILSLSHRHELLLRKNLNIGESAWSVCDPAGRSELAFFPLHINQQTFVLVISGTPQLQRQEFISLTQLLCQRYG